MEAVTLRRLGARRFKNISFEVGVYAASRATSTVPYRASTQVSPGAAAAA
jgi:hypothetical protein